MGAATLTQSSEDIQWFLVQVLPKWVLSLGFGMFPLLSGVFFGCFVVSFFKSCVLINDFMILFPFQIAKDAKECVQECVSEFISFITSEASERCHQEKRKTINGEDILFAMSTLGFDSYVEPLKLYLQKFREVGIYGHFLIYLTGCVYPQLSVVVIVKWVTCAASHSSWSGNNVMFKSIPEAVKRKRRK